MIQIKNLSKVFRTEELETKALNEVSITMIFFATRAVSLKTASGFGV